MVLTTMFKLAAPSSSEAHDKAIKKAAEILGCTVQNVKIYGNVGVSDYTVYGLRIYDFMFAYDTDTDQAKISYW